MLVCLAASFLLGGAERAVAQGAEGNLYTVTEFVPTAVEGATPPIPPDDLLRIEVEVGVTPEGYVRPQPGLETARFSLGAVPADRPPRFFGTALQSILQQIVVEVNRRGIQGVTVAPSDADIDPQTTQDLRGERTELRLVVFAGRVKGVRSFAFGERVPREEGADNPLHEEIRKQSPLQLESLIREDLLNDYLYLLNRHAGRRVEAQITPSAEPGYVYLDYQVSETKPWAAYLQYSNTGTDETTRNRERIGFIHNQLTNNDDILRLDYITGDLDSVNAVFTSYEAPFPGHPRIRWRLDASWSQYDSSEFGFGSTFEGEEYEAAGQFLVNVFQHHQLFVDLIAGIRYLDVDTVDKLFDQSGDEDFVLPFFGFQVERVTDPSTLLAAVTIEFNLAELANTDRIGVQLLGRFGAEREFTILRWNVSYSFFAEPILFGNAWRDPATPSKSTLAHEFFLGFKGQYAFNNRLIPQQEQIAGGLYTVRGYPQSIVAGDDVYIGTLEYRFHIPRIFPITPQPAQLPILGEFAVARRDVFSQPDWDLILRLFMDQAWVRVNKPVPGERNEILRSAGAGLELQVKQNFSVRFDWGVALEEVRGGVVRKGSHEYHVVVTLLY